MAAPTMMGLASVRPATKPHLVMMAIDDLGWTDVGFHGGNFPTPNIDALAKDGVKLDKYYVQQVCSPTRSALMTARYPFRTGLQHVTTLAPGTEAKIPSDTATIAEVLKSVGYSTHAIGKWHLGYAGWENTPLGRGFDSYAGYLQGGEDYYTHEVRGGFDLWRNKTAAWDVQGNHSTPFFMDEAKRVLDSHNPATPMFMYFAHQEVHAPSGGACRQQLSPGVCRLQCDVDARSGSLRWPAHALHDGIQRRHGNRHVCGDAEG